MATILLWALTLHLNSYSKQLTGAQGPTCQTAGRWTTQGEEENSLTLAHGQEFQGQMKSSILKACRAEIHHAVTTTAHVYV